MNKHTATHQGFTFTRNSKGRTYSHAILVRGSIAADRVQAEAQTRDMWKRNLKYYSQLAGGVHQLAQEYPSQYSAERIASDIADAQAWIAKGEDGHVAECLQEFDGRTKRQTTNDGDTYFTCDGWASRLDLAHKAASRWGDRAVIVEATRN